MLLAALVWGCEASEDGGAKERRTSILLQYDRLFDLNRSASSEASCQTPAEALRISTQVAERHELIGDAIEERFGRGATTGYPSRTAVPPASLDAEFCKFFKKPKQELVRFNTAAAKLEAALEF
jgi:hypothetical protein